MNRFLFFVLCVGTMACSGSRRVTALWEPISSQEAQGPEVLPTDYELYRLDIDQLRGALDQTGNDDSEGVYVQFPTPSGTMNSFKVWTSGVVSESLAKKYPNLKAYQGFSPTRVSTRIRLELPNAGLQVMVNDDSGTWFIAPFNSTENLYMVFNKQDMPSNNNFWEGRIE